VGSARTQATRKARVTRLYEQVTAIKRFVEPCIPAAGRVIRAPWFSLAAGGFVPRVTWHDADGTIHIVDGPDAFTTWREAEEASRFLGKASVD
jgi:hypothetical protein